ncbi:transcobalamin-2 [Aplochiton taeniatus]
MYTLCILTGLLALVTSKPCDTEGADHSEVLLSLNKDLLRSLEEAEGLLNPSVHLALRLSNHHNLAKESESLNALKTQLHSDLESSLANGQAIVGRLALYTLALRSSCYDLSTVTFTVNQVTETLLTHLKRQMEHEKEHFAISERPLTNYYQYSLGVLTLCVSGVRVNSHASNKLIRAVEHGHIKSGESECIDTLAMAGMALQCVKEAGSQVQHAVALQSALVKIKQKLLASRRPDGHMGNEFSTGLAVQALLAMGNHVAECATSLEAMRADYRKKTYHNPMALSQTLPALQQKTYLQVKDKQCLGEEDTLVLEPRQPVVVFPSPNKVALTVEVVKADGTTAVFSVHVPKDTSLAGALDLLQNKNDGFAFEKESSLWGPFLSVVNGERARQSDRRYWHLSSNGSALSQGIKDFKIEAAQKITIKNSSY